VARVDEQRATSRAGIIVMDRCGSEIEWEGVSGANMWRRVEEGREYVRYRLRRAAGRKGRNAQTNDADCSKAAMAALSPWCFYRRILCISLLKATAGYLPAILNLKPRRRKCFL